MISAVRPVNRSKGESHFRMTSLLPLALLLATLIGLSLGLLGAGGSIITVPIFVYVLGLDAKVAVATSLPVVGITSFFGALGHWRSGNLKLAVAFAFGAAAMVGAFTGARLSRFISGRTQLVLLAIVMLAAAFFMFRGGIPGVRAEAEPGLKRRGATSWVLTAVIALAVGILTGLVGIGGGFLIVPALVLLGRVPMKAAVGTSLLVISLNAASGTIGYTGQVAVDWRFVAMFASVAVVGILLGTYLIRFVKQAVLRRAFAVFLVAVGLLILYENWAVVLPSATPPSH